MFQCMNCKEMVQLESTTLTLQLQDKSDDDESKSGEDKLEKDSDEAGIVDEINEDAVNLPLSPGLMTQLFQNHSPPTTSCKKSAQHVSLKKLNEDHLLTAAFQNIPNERKSHRKMMNQKSSNIFFTDINDGINASSPAPPPRPSTSQRRMYPSKRSPRMTHCLPLGDYQRSRGVKSSLTIAMQNNLQSKGRRLNINDTNEFVVHAKSKTKRKSQDTMKIQQDKDRYDDHDKNHFLQTSVGLCLQMSPIKNKSIGYSKNTRNKYNQAIKIHRSKSKMKRMREPLTKDQFNILQQHIKRKQINQLYSFRRKIKVPLNIIPK
jgi:hypothetical protein